MNDKKENITEKRKNTQSLEAGKITNCPICGVDLRGEEPCASINCPCAPRITV
jgi:hypothetical protein